MTKAGDARNPEVPKLHPFLICIERHVLGGYEDVKKFSCFF